MVSQVLYGILLDLHTLHVDPTSLLISSLKSHQYVLSMRDFHHLRLQEIHKQSPFL